MRTLGLDQRMSPRAEAAGLLGGGQLVAGEFLDAGQVRGAPQGAVAQVDQVFALLTPAQHVPLDGTEEVAGERRIAAPVEAG